MAELKTKPTQASVQAFLKSLADEATRADCVTLVRMMEQATGAKPRMWGASIVGFGDYHYKSPKTGREGDWFLSGFSPHKDCLSLYCMCGFEGMDDLLAKLGKCKTSVGCLYVKRLSDIDLGVLRKLLDRGVKQIRKMEKEAKSSTLVNDKMPKNTGPARKKAPAKPATRRKTK